MAHLVFRLSVPHTEHMNRRSFFETIAAAFAFDPERLLWTPGKKLISIPGESLRLRKSLVLLNIDTYGREVSFQVTSHGANGHLLTWEEHKILTSEKTTIEFPQDLRDQVHRINARFTSDNKFTLYQFETKTPIEFIPPKMHGQFNSRGHVFQLDATMDAKNIRA